MYWLRGEGFGNETSPSQLSLFLSADAATLEPLLAIMQIDGLVESGSSGEGSYQLSDIGAEEGGRRFTEEFADAGLGAAGHGTCKPGCDCELHGHECCDHSHDHEAAH